jgi:hypothetical protein
MLADLVAIYHPSVFIKPMLLLDYHGIQISEDSPWGSSNDTYVGQPHTVCLSTLYP